MKKLNVYEEASRCLLCQDAPCTKACKNGDPVCATPCALDVNRNFDLHVFSRAGPVAAATNLADKSAHPVLA